MPGSAPVCVLQVLACDDVGGTENMVALLSERVDRSRVRSDVATLASPGPVAQRLERSGVRVFSLGGQGLATATWRLAGLLHRRRYDVVNAYGVRASLVARLARRVVSPDAAFICGVRGLHVTEVEDITAPKARVALALERLGAPLVSIYDANSTGAVELLASAGIDRGRMRYIPNGLDLDDWPARPDPGAREDPPGILCVSRFVPRKRHQDLIDALALLSERGIRFRATLAGDGPTRPEIQTLAHRRGIADSVHFAGTLGHAELREHLRSAAVFCLPSLWEGMPGALMEAMASAVPVVATAVNGALDLVEHGTSGLLVAPKGPAELADALAAVLLDPELAARLGAGARQRIESGFTVASMVAAKERLYLECAGSV